ncbi:MAG: hypothetical protein ACI9P5_002570 [Saprospiraceae bacterium]|jgi:hypothetical protein
MRNDILDIDLINSNEITFSKNEKLVWSDRPKRYFSIALFESISRDESVKGIVIIELIIIVFLFVKIFTQHEKSHNIGVLIFFAILGLFAFVFELSKNYRKSKTTYYLTNKRIIIKTVRWFRKRTYEIKIDQIGRTSYVGYNDGHGTIFLQLFENTNIKSYDFSTSSKRHHPTLELVRNYIDVNDLIKRKIEKLSKGTK